MEDATWHLERVGIKDERVQELKKEQREAVTLAGRSGRQSELPEKQLLEASKGVRLLTNEQKRLDTKSDKLKELEQKQAQMCKIASRKQKVIELFAEAHMTQGFAKDGMAERARRSTRSGAAPGRVLHAHGV